jgi:hypothetical protein
MGDRLPEKVLTKLRLKQDLAPVSFLFLRVGLWKLAARDCVNRAALRGPITDGPSRLLVPACALAIVHVCTLPEAQLSETGNLRRARHRFS